MMKGSKINNRILTVAQDQGPKTANDIVKTLQRLWVLTNIHNWFKGAGLPPQGTLSHDVLGIAEKKSREWIQDRELNKAVSAWIRVAQME